jgi:hypothetical protein
MEKPEMTEQVREFIELRQEYNRLVTALSTHYGDPEAQYATEAEMLAELMLGALWRDEVLDEIRRVQEVRLKLKAMTEAGVNQAEQDYQMAFWQWLSYRMQNAVDLTGGQK